ncbi:WD repeat protein [Aspergillus homomorphus CBS 101889]|uniref:WD40 repeat-like protein n=1 Tax=Aspergillus homomorphus (strain CBS 101889) TaxID=1450537 RepID=A0A395HMP5_ASPHC|nr:WD40 repeat-like protein [Aspergillus homomorphus CBS 101889]RAL07544.1 WD40 repeat-like protein [Aspergillus homomorphus CBS 101889]
MSDSEHGRLPKRSRASEVARGQMTSSDGVRIKRRRTSTIDDEASATLRSNMAESPRTALCAGTPAEDIPEACEGEQTNTSFTNWFLSDVVAGKFGHASPLFTSDDEYLFLGLETSVQIYSVTTSRLFRTLKLKPCDNVIGYKLSPSNSDHLYVFSSTGSVSKWEWFSGQQLPYQAACRPTICVDVCSDISESDALFFIHDCEDSKKEIALRRSNDEDPRPTSLLTTNAQLTHLRVAYQGRILVAFGGQNVLLGSLVPSQDSKTVQYTWSELTLPTSITSADIRHRAASQRAGTSGVKERAALGNLDLVLGESGGSIMIYNDILNSLQNEIGSGKGLTPRRLHWHRSCVNVVRWSKDGNYVISGGNESVMVLWQLDTSRKQFLPHLSSPICNIALSMSGSLYAVKLADNSTVVLSARDLQPLTTITGLQLCSIPTKPHSQVSTKKLVLAGAIAAALHPKHPDQLLLTVPASCQVTQEGYTLANACTLQTYDIRTNSHISRQALARTNTTTLRTSPDGSYIVAPDVSHLRITRDGKWMATIDSWSPYARDVQALHPGEAHDGRIFTDNQETYLKFWRWNSLSTMWELVTRIDAPHFSSKGAARVLNLAVRTLAHEFATIGADGVLRFWCPSVRQRSGLKAADTEQLLETWKCRSAIDLKSYIDVDQSTRVGAAYMDYSQDGSVLAICLKSTSSLNPGLTLLIDAQSCCIRYSRVGLHAGDFCGAAFLGPQLLITSARSVFIWDIVNDFVRNLGLSDAAENTQPYPSRLLAVSVETKTFAIATQVHQHKNTASKKRRRAQPHIQVYDIETLNLLSENMLDSSPVALLSDRHSADYVVVDATAKVQRFSCLGSAIQATHTNSPHIQLETSGLAGLFGQQGHGGLGNMQQSATAPNSLGISSQTQLASVFGDIPPFVLPSANLLFRDVVQALSA